MRTVIVLLLAGANLLLGCAGVRVSQRQQVEGAQSRMIASPYGPEGREGCVKVAEATCPYMNVSFESVQSACAKQMRSSAEEAKANYIHINEPKQSVGGFAVRSPIVTMYTCTSLIEN